MADTFEAQWKFSLKDKDSKLYHKYGVPAIELANDGEYLAAVKLIDKILKDNSKVEFALLLKANYMLNYVTNSFDFGEVTPEDLEKAKTKTQKLKKDLEECIRLIDEALKLNPKNTNGKSLKSFIQKNALKETNKLLDSIPEKNEIVDTSFACPYCTKVIEVQEGVQDKVMDIECEFCNKTFKCYTGKILVIRGRTNAAWSYGPEPISITLHTKNEDINVNFKSRARFLVHRGDRVTFIFLKQILSQSFKENPSYIYNWSADELFKL